MTDPTPLQPPEGFQPYLVGDIADRDEWERWAPRSGDVWPYSNFPPSVVSDVVWLRRKPAKATFTVDQLRRWRDYLTWPAVWSEINDAINQAEADQ